jgi:hypothetical protein
VPACADQRGYFGLEAHELGGERRQAIYIAGSPTIVDLKVAAFDPSLFGEFQAEGRIPNSALQIGFG